MENLIRIIEASPRELMEMKSLGEPSGLLGIYRDVVLAYLKADMQVLEQCIQKLEGLKSDSGTTVVLELARLRKVIRERGNTEVDRLLDLLEVSSQWKGEGFITIGRLLDINGDFVNAQKYYHLAAVELERIGAKKKVVKALLNCVTIESCIYPEKKLMMDYNFIANKAEEVGETEVAGVCLLNISREYQLMGATFLALKVIDEAINTLEKNHYGGVSYYLSLVHRCHLFIEFQRYSEARLDFERSRGSEHPEVKEALKVIENLLQKEETGTADGKISNANLIPTWKERFENLTAPKTEKVSKLGELEEKLIQFLSQGPRSKFEIIEYLYGTAIDFRSLQERFKKVIARIRKKRPGLIVFEEGNYRIVDEVYLGEGA